MFDLDKAIKKWRKELKKNEAMENGYVEELESHLRDEIDRQFTEGLSWEEAFERAVEEIGGVENIGAEYYKTNTYRLSGKPPWRSKSWVSGLVWNYYKVAFRKIRRHKGYSFINIAGLAIGMACCILMLLWVQDELSFDRFHKNGNDIYRVISEFRTSGKVTHNARTPNPLGPALAERYPEVINFTRYQGFDDWLVKCGEKSFLNDFLGTADPSFFEIFTFPFVKGDPKTALNNRHSIVITEKMARKYFDDADPMGKVLTIGHDFTVTGVIKDVPENSHLHFDCIFPIVNMEDFWHDDFSNWQRTMFYMYVQLQKGSSGKEVSNKIAGTVKENVPKSQRKIYLQPLKDVHLRSDFEADLDNYNQGNMVLVFVFSLTALVILLIACINFMNLATARSANRAKEVSMRKVSGAKRGDIIRQFMGESLLMSIIALLLALILVEFFLPLLNDLSGKELTLNFTSNIQLIIGLILIALATGLLSGSYPAFYLSAFRPADILKKHFDVRIRGGFFRKFLVVFQFSLTIILLIGTTVIYRQLDFMSKKDLGFDKDHVLYFGTRHANEDPFAHDLLQNPNVLNVSYSEAPGREPWGVTGFEWEGKDPEKDVMLFPVVVDYEYLKTFGMSMVEGRFFSREFSTDHTDAVVVNETAVKAMGLESPIGKKLSYRDQIEGRIIGVMKDFHQSSLHNAIEPLLFRFNTDGEGYHHVAVRINPESVPATLSYIESVWKKYIQNYPFEYEFLDEEINNYYKTERKVGRIFQSFTSLAILIACLGLFGLASFTAEQRTKEIGIRKVLGASISRIVIMLSEEFAKWVLLANIIAWPVAYFISKRWLSEYAYRIPLGWRIFLFSAALALVIAVLTVSFQAVKAATANPVDSLRYE
ncbi:MAG: ABC transporter permease [Candidatus Aminicenantes bacterium]|nr:ABC transporter permease [Candidatus Aminicenantes bacterium]